MTARELTEARAECDRLRDELAHAQEGLREFARERDAYRREAEAEREKRRAAEAERDALRLRLAEVERERDAKDEILSAYVHKEHACDGDVCEVCAGNGACCEHRDQQTKEIARLQKMLDVCAVVHEHNVRLKAERDAARRVAKRLALDWCAPVDGRECSIAEVDVALAYEVEP